MATTKKATTKARPRAASSGGPARVTKGAHLGFRVDDSILRLLDERAEQLMAERPGSIVTRSDVAREILYRALQEAAKAKK
jgi:hypothetical protein